MTDSRATPLEAHVLGVKDLDGPVYRVFKLWHFEEALRLRCFWLYPPGTWDDPHESLLQHCFVDKDNVPYQLKSARAYAQCWSATGDSDTLLRAYSFVVRDHATERNLYPGAEGVLVRSTPRKLLDALIASQPDEVTRQSCFLGRVEYHSTEEIHSLVASAVSRYGIDAFKDAKMRARSLLVKRHAFRHEDELRLLYVEWRSLDKPPSRIQLRFEEAADVIDEVTFDPRLKGLDTEEREAMLKSRKYIGSVGHRAEYRRVLLQIGVPDALNDSGDSRK
jgi:hypothetical protein